MLSDALIGLINNATLLLGLVLVYTFIPQRPQSNTQLYHTVSGLLLGAVSALIMLNPWHLEPGVQFDTRSILLSITGLYFRPRAAVIAAIITSIVRIYRGGGGAFTGVSVIIMSVSVGMIWRRLRNTHVDSLSWQELYAFGWVVHIFMVLLMLTMPRAIVWDVLKAITLPVLAIYPVGTVLVGKLLERERSRRISEIAVRRSEERFRRAMENIPGVVVIYDRDLRIQYINAATRQITGLSAAEFIGRREADIWPPEVYTPYMPTLEAALKTKTTRSIEVDLTLPGAGTRTLAITCVPLLDEHGEVREVLGITHDFTERKQAEREIRQLNESLEQRIAERTAELQRSEARYRAIIEDQTDLVCRFGRDGSLTFVNSAFCTYFDRPPEDLAGTSLFALLSGDNRAILQRHIAALGRENPVVTLETHEITSTGTPRWVHWIGRMLFDAGGEFVEYQAVGRDITERKLAEDRLRRMFEREMELGVLKSRYVSMAAHDLRNPLAVIQSAVDLLHRYDDRLVAEQKEAKFEGIKNSIKVMVAMLDDILTIGQVESGKLTFTSESFDLLTFCNTIVTETQQTTGSTQPVHFSSKGGYGTVYADPKLLRHILGNLLSNAIKYSPENRPVTFTVHCQPDAITFCVEDQGIGIPASDQVHLFEPFHRASNVHQIPGTGLGLAIVKRSVDLHGGTITVESEEGVGTTFTVVIPQVPPAT